MAARVCLFRGVLCESDVGSPRITLETLYPESMDSGRTHFHDLGVVGTCCLSSNKEQRTHDLASVSRTV
jgi:hypothetical protein